VVSRLPFARAADAIPATTPVRRVLVVDDDDDVTTSLADRIEGLGHQVRTAGDGASALATLAYFDADVVVLELVLPDTSGIELARAVRERAGRDLVLVAITGGGAPGDGELLERAGFDRCLVKPIAIESLSELLGTAALTPPVARRRPGRGSPLASRRHLIAAADRAGLGTDAATFAAAVRQLLPVVDDHLAFELVAVIELASYDVELATLRWSHLRRRL
jgi:CheY-like chemotaxis protein